MTAAREPMSRAARILSVLVLATIALATAASVAVTMRLNYLFVTSMVDDAEKKLLVGWGTVIADLWKASGLIFVPLLWRWRQYATALAGALVWALCFVWAVVSLLGSVGQERMVATGGRESVHATFVDVEKELNELEGRRKSLRRARPARELEALVTGALSRTVSGITSSGRVRTVGDLSRDCIKPDRDTTEACNEVNELRAELAAAVESTRLDARIDELRKRVAVLREKGGTLSSDVQSEMIARFTRGLVTTKDAAMGLPLLVTAVFEAIGALGPAVLFAVIRTSYESDVRVQTRPFATGRERIVSASVLTGLVVDFLDDCTEPRDDGRALALSELYTAYQNWCEGRRATATSLKEFTADLDRERERPEMRGRVRKFGDRYYGIGLVQS
jgi:phage host-nuclease inhibitor protein Gam